jgi:hypothetical protein
MTTEPAAIPAPHDQAAQYLAVIAASLSASGITSRLSQLAGTPVLTAAAPGGGPDPAMVAIHPDPYADPGAVPGPQFDCTCTWTPAPGTSPQATATAITAILRAARAAVPGLSRRPPHADAARLAGFLSGHPSWSAFWDPRYGLWRTAEDDPGSGLYAETPDAAAVISYITSCSQAAGPAEVRSPAPMTDADPAVPPPPEDLTARVFRALYPEFDLHDLAGIYLAVPAGTPCFAAPAIGEIAHQISGRDHRALDPPEALHHPRLPCRPEPRR